MSQLQKPTCLLVPLLCEGKEVLIHWSPVEQAESYQLDAVFDNTFDALSSTGCTWFEFSQKGRNWSQAEEQDLMWDSLENLSASTTVYQGQGAVSAAYLGGYSWAASENLGFSWQELEAPGANWQQAESMTQTGPSWEQADAGYSTWDELEGKSLCWQDLETLPSLHSWPYRHCTVSIPSGARYAYFRLRAFDKQGVASAYIQSARCPVMTEKCLHIPRLYEGEEAEIYWRDIAWATSYQLECVYENTFDQPLAVVALYRGRGEPASKDVQFTDPRTWQEADAGFQTWEEMEQRGSSWKSLEEQPPEAGLPYRKCKVKIPMGIRYVYFRLRVLGPEKEEITLLSSRMEVIQLEKAQIFADAGSQLLIFAQAAGVQCLQDLIFTTRYDKNYLRFGGFTLKMGGVTAPLFPNLQAPDSVEGIWRFTSLAKNADSLLRSGLAGMLRMDVQKGGGSEIMLGVRK